MYINSDAYSKPIKRVDRNEISNSLKVFLTMK